MKTVTIPLLRTNVRKALTLFEIWIVFYAIFSFYRLATNNYALLVMDLFWLIIGVFLFISRYSLLKNKKEVISKTIISLDTLKRNLLIQKFYTIFLTVIFIIFLIGFNETSIGFLFFIIFFIIEMRLLKKYIRGKKGFSINSGLSVGLVW